MAVAKNTGDSGTPNAHTAFNAAVTSLSYAGYTVGVGVNVVLIGVLFLANGTPSDITGTPTLTWDGVSMTRMGTGVYLDGRVEFFYLLNPNTGNKTALANWAVAHDATLGLISFTGADTPVSGDTVTNTGTSAAPTTGAITSDANGATLGAMNNRGGVTSTTTQTQLFKDATNWNGCAVSYALGGTANTHTWAISTNTYEAMGIHIPAASADITGRFFLVL